MRLWLNNLRMLMFEPDRTVREMTCPNCQRPYRLVTLFIDRDGEAHAICYASLHTHGDVHEAWIDAALGSWNDGEGADRVTFGCRVGPIAGQTEPAASLVLGGIPFGDAPILGKRLPREEALVHPWLSDYWELVDFVLLMDPDVHIHVYGHKRTD